MKKTCRLAAGALVLIWGSAAGAQEAVPPKKAPECKVPAEAVKVENPVKATAGSIREGRDLFQTQCALCHGKTGDGKGDMVEPMKLVLRDYRDPAALRDISDGALFHVVKKGCEQMLGEEGRLKENQMWDLVNYIRSLARKEAVAQKETPES